MSPKSLVLLAVLATLAPGCSLLRPMLPPDLPQALPAVTRPSPVTDTGSSALLDIDAGFDPSGMFVLRPLALGDANKRLPVTLIRGLRVTESSVHDALRLLADHAGLQLSISGGAEGLKRNGAVGMYNVSGPSGQVLDQLAKRMGFFWSVDGDTLQVDQEQQFVVELPPILADDSFSSLATTLQGLGAKDVLLNRDERTLVLRADSRSLAKVEGYLNYIRANRTMIIYDIDVWQVSLDDAHTKGVDWSKLAWTYAAGNAATTLGVANVAASTAAGIAFTRTTDKFQLAGLVQFLETQGTVKTVSHPRLAVMSGSKGKLSVGQSTTYVSKVSAGQHHGDRRPGAGAQAF